MPKKIFDIIPPKQKKMEKRFEETKVFIRQKEKDPGIVKEIASQLEQAKEPVISRPKKATFKKAFKGFLLVCLAVLCIGFAGIVLNSLSEVRVRIKVWPKISDFGMTKDMTADLSQKEINYEKGILPAEIVNSSKTETQEFSATGKKNKEEKAKGVIRVYNSFSDASQVLVLGTRFISADGKLFKATSRSTIPGGTYKGGKLVAGEADVSVEASEAGESYNIGPTNFSIPGFAGTSKYTSIYGKSLSNMTGGSKSEVTIVTADDLDKAEAELLDKAKKSGLDALKASLSSDTVLLDKASFQTVKETVFSSKTGDKIEKFTLEITIDSSGLVFKKSDMQSFAQAVAISGIVKENIVEDNSMQIGYSFQRLNYQNEKVLGITFSVDIRAKHYLKIDLDKIKESLLGKSFEEVKMYLSGNTLGISKVEISPGLFWRKSVPKNGKNVDIVLELDE